MNLIFALLVTAVSIQANAQNLVGYTFSLDNKSTPFEIELKPFSTDGCTKYEDGPADNPTLWQHCCVQHDMAYWLGGTDPERKIADQDLKQCVEATGNPGAARVMYLGTRAGGGPLGHNTYRWGFGWNRIRDYKKLTNTELEMAYKMYGPNLENLKKDAVENKLPIIVPESYDYVSPFPYSFCEEEIIKHLSPKLTRNATVTRFNDYLISTGYHIRIGLDICDESLEFKFSEKTDASTCKTDYSYSKTTNKIENVKISNACLKRIKSLNP